jgi:hypothetical protein
LFPASANIATLRVLALETGMQGVATMVINAHLGLRVIASVGDVGRGTAVYDWGC